MNPRICPALLCSGLWALTLFLTGCSQLTTSKPEQAALQAAADRAGAAYLDCYTQTAGRYLATGEGAEAIARGARKDCAAARASAGSAQQALQETRYILADPQVAIALKALDEQGEAAIARQVLDRRAAIPTPVPIDKAQPAAPTGYMACMQAQGERYATVNEPAEVVAEVAHSRCAGNLGAAGNASEMERQGRALVMGLVLDRKVPSQ